MLFDIGSGITVLELLKCFGDFSNSLLHSLRNSSRALVVPDYRQQILKLKRPGYLRTESELKD